jgi:hypothetical protein
MGFDGVEAALKEEYQIEWEDVIVEQGQQWGH